MTYICTSYQYNIWRLVLIKVYAMADFSFRSTSQIWSQNVLRVWSEYQYICNIDIELHSVVRLVFYSNDICYMCWLIMLCKYWFYSLLLIPILNGFSQGLNYIVSADILNAIYKDELSEKKIIDLFLKSKV